MISACLLVVWACCVVLTWAQSAMVQDTSARPVFPTLTNENDVSIVITMICRNEAVNFRANLALWLKVVDYFVFIMDDRNSDDSETVIHSILTSGPTKAKGYDIYKNTFSGFGHARTLSLARAWQKYPQASHVIIADPDWRPRSDTLQKHELITANAEVYRFTVYDRSGATKRRIDWMLRHREGLQMRYHLHEVLDIGYYTWTDTGWTIDEIEQPGTWHTEEGHTDSFAAKRYLFDLSMLEKDAVMYSNDPHVDYYLGITHHAYAEKMIEQLAKTYKSIEVDDKMLSADNYLYGNAHKEQRDSINHHLTEAVKYLERRSTHYYNEEFIEQRWGTMMTLAGIYSNEAWLPFYDFQKAKLWYTHCINYNPNLYECSAHLLTLYLKQHLLPEALEFANELTTRAWQQRLMLNSLNNAECHLAALIINVYGMDLLIQSNAADVAASEINNNNNNNNRSTSHLPVLNGHSHRDAQAGYLKYMLLLSKMVNEYKECSEEQRQYATIQAETQLTIDRYLSPLDSSQVNVNNDDGDENSKSNTIEQWCNDEQLLAFISTQKIALHPCINITAVNEGAKLCADFTSSMPSLYEEHQVKMYEEFLGTASIVDIVHNIYNGDASRVVRVAHPFRVLFAEYFNIRMVINLIGYAVTKMSRQIEIVLVTTNPHLANEVQNQLSACFTEESLQLINFVSLQQIADLGEWLRAYSDNLWNPFLSTEQKDNYKFFDFVEYHGSSVSVNYEEELMMILDLLQYDGSVGLSYMTNNRHYHAINDILAETDVEAFPPFSTLPEKLVNRYLQYHHLEQYTKDLELMRFLSNDPTASIDNSSPIKDRTSRGMYAQRRVFTGEDINESMKKLGYRVTASFPGTDTNRYDGVDGLDGDVSMDVSRWGAVGVTRKQYAQYFGISFRGTLLLQRRDLYGNSTGKRVGVAKLRDLLDSENVGDNVIIIDRSGTSLSNMFPESSLIGSLLRSSSMTINLQSHVRGNETYTVPGAILPCIHLLSKVPTFGNLISTTVTFWQNKGLSISTFHIRSQVILLLEFLQAVGKVTYIHSLQPTDDTGRLMDVSTDIRPSSMVKTADLSNGNMRKPKMHAKVPNTDGSSSDDNTQVYDNGDGGTTIENTKHARGEKKPRDTKKTREIGRLKEDIDKLLNLLKAAEGADPGEELPESGNDDMDNNMNLNANDDGSGKDVGSVTIPLVESLADTAKRKLVKPDWVKEVLLPVDDPHARIYVQSLHALTEESHRRIACTGSDHMWLQGDCIRNKAFDYIEKRVTAYINYVCNRKLNFDERQFKYIATKKPQLRKVIIDVVLPHFQEVRDRMTNVYGIEPKAASACVLLTQEDLDAIDGYINRAFLISREPLIPMLNMMHEGAFNQMRIGKINLSVNDFVVIDVILKTPVLQAVSETLLLSTFWFDNPNDYAFVSHHDDGLGHEIFRKLAMELTKSISEIDTVPLQVVKYFAVSMDKNRGGMSPIMAAQQGQLAMILWLSPTQKHMAKEEPTKLIESTTDGLHIYSRKIGSSFAEKHISFDPSYHSDFYSINSSFNFMIPDRHAHGEYISRAANRLVMIDEQRPFFFAVEAGGSPEGFDKDTVQAFVLIVEAV